VAVPASTFVCPNKTIAIGVLPGVFVQAFAGKLTLAELETVLPMLDHPTLGDRYVQLVRVAPTGVHDAPDDEFRARVAQTAREREGKTLAFAYVVVGDGFLGSMIRAVITGITVLSRPKHPEKVFSEPQAAIAWLVGHLPAGSVDPAQVLRTLDELIDLAGPKR
jgi:hypothetical protein